MDIRFGTPLRLPLSTWSWWLLVLVGLGVSELLLPSFGFSLSLFFRCPLVGDCADDVLDRLERPDLDEDTEPEDFCRLCLDLVEDDATELLEGDDLRRRDSRSQVCTAWTLDALDSSMRDSQSRTGCWLCLLESCRMLAITVVNLLSTRLKDDLARAITPNGVEPDKLATILLPQHPPSSQFSPVGGKKRLTVTLPEPAARFGET